MISVQSSHQHAEVLLRATHQININVMRGFLLIVLSILAIPSLRATTYYVSNSGDNSNDGLSPDNAFETIQFAEDQAVPGDSIIVANGSYAGFYVDVSGTMSAPIVFLAEGDAVMITSPTSTNDGINVEGVEGATVDFIEINGFIVDDMPRNGIRLVWANNCIVRHCSCDNNFERGILTGFTNDILLEYNVCTNSIDEHGIYVSNSSDRSIIRYNICHHNNGGGIQINADASLGGDGISSDPEIYGNVLYENGNGGGAAINLDGVQGALIYNNLLYENHATGIALFQIDGGGPSINATVVHNTIVQASNGRWCLLLVNGATGAKVYNNILINQHPFRGSIAVSSNSLTGLVSDYNIVVNSFSDDGGSTFLDFAEWQDLGYDADSDLAEPIPDIFVDPSGGDYHLLDASQPVDAGNGALSQGVSTDLDGNPRPAGPEHDIGSYENQVVLSIDEEEKLPDRPHRWMSMRDVEGHIFIDGLSAGDRVSAVDLNGRAVLGHDVDSSGQLSTSIDPWPPGYYVIAVFRGHRLLGAYAFVKVE